jgi:hypothetical protein
MKPRLILFTIYWLMTGVGSAQNCPANMEMANKMLEAREYRVSVDLVKGCIVPQESNWLRWQAYRVLAIGYLYLGKQDSAAWACDSLIQINPGFVADKVNYPSKMIKMVNERVVVVAPTFYTNYFGGATVSQIKVNKLYGAAPVPKTYLPLLGAQIGVQMGWYVSPKISFDFGATVNANRYGIRYDIPDWKLYYEEQQLTMQMPLMMQYVLNEGKRMRYGLRLGVYKQYLLTSENSFAATYISTGEETNLNRELTSDRRNRWYNGCIFGVNSLYKVGKGHINFQASFIKSFTPYNIPETRFDETHLFYKYFYFDDDINFNNFSFSIGYTRLFHGKVKKYAQ